MESDLGKLFIGGISWDTNEDRLKEYFSKYGEVVESVIMRDRATGRARGFGFVVFADPAAAERVIMDKHMIDGRMVEAKKAVPRDDQHILNKTPNTAHGSLGPGRTRKIFVGGLASSVTETDFRNYFEQFGNITDVVVMYDHNTQRPRGFGFITYDSEESVEHVLHKTFHELNGKMVEVKRAVPKEFSPGPTRSSLIGYGNHAINRASNFLNSYPPAYNINSLGGIGMRVQSGFSNSLAADRTGFVFPSFGSTTLAPTYSSTSNFSPRTVNPFYNVNSSRYNTPTGFNARSSSVSPQTNRNVWGNGNFNTAATNPTIPGPFLGSASFGNGERAAWEPFPVSAQLGGNSSSYPTQAGLANSYVGNGGDNSYSLGGGAFMRNPGGGVVSSALFPTSIGSSYEGSYGDIYRGSSVNNSTWQSTTREFDSASLVYGLGNVDSDAKGSDGYIGSYSTANRQTTRGIAT